MTEGRWVSREEKRPSGQIIRWRERQLKDGSFERVFEEDSNGIARTGGPISTKAAA